ncbi:MAG: type IV pilus assembly protein PilM, partial [Armatimonadetes bacterium]|nr:type IV pilus assembly protein PilM [Armatimonadota bacterium]
MSILGIDIGSDTIKVVEMAKAKGGYRLLNYGIAPTPPDSVVDGDVRDPEMVAEALKQLLKTHKIKSNRCVASVQGSKSTVVRIIELPRVSKNELAETMKFEVERHIPFAASQIIMDYAVVDRPGEPLDAPNMEVLFAAVQEEVVELLCDTLRRSKLKPRAIDVQPLALSRSLVETTSAGHGIGETVAVINMGATITELSIVRDGLLHFPRAIPIAGRSISQRLSEGLGISEQQAERQKREYATVRPLPPGAAPAVPEPEAEEEPTVDVADVALGYDVFETDSGEESDVGFGGTGTGESGFSFEETDAAEVQTQEPAGSSAFELSDEGDSEGPSFDFGFDDDSKGPSYSLSPKDEDEDDPEAPVPDDEIVFSFGDDTEEAAPELVVEEATEDEGFSFGPVAAADDEGFSFAAEPAAAEAGAADEGFSFAAEPVAAEGAEG